MWGDFLNLSMRTQYRLKLSRILRVSIKIILARHSMSVDLNFFQIEAIHSPPNPSINIRTRGLFVRLAPPRRQTRGRGIDIAVDFIL